MFHLGYVQFDDLFCEYLESSKPRNMQVQQYHDGYEIYLQVKGERYLFMNGACHTLKPMDLYVVEPYELHYAQSLDSPFYGRYVVNFHDEKLKIILSSEELRLLMEKVPTGVYHLDEHHFKRIYQLFQDLDNCQKDRSPLSKKIKCTYIFLMLNLISDYSKTTTSSNATDPSARPEILAVVNYINKHYRDPLTLDDVAEHVDMSKYHFCRLFKCTTGSSFVQYLNNLRISKVHKMLLETKLSIGDIASLTGFSTREQLTRVFKSVYLVSPAVFRKQNQSTKESADNE